MVRHTAEEKGRSAQEVQLLAQVYTVPTWVDWAAVSRCAGGLCLWLCFYGFACN